MKDPTFTEHGDLMIGLFYILDNGEHALSFDPDKPKLDLMIIDVPN